MAFQRSTLLMTRPKDASMRFVRQLDANLLRDVELCVSPLIEIVPLSNVPDFAGISGLVFTSVHGVAAAVRATDERDVPAFCVGPATTQAARDAGWDAQLAGQDAENLITALIGEGPKAPLLHIRGEFARGDIAARLSAAGIKTHEAVCYKQQAMPFLHESEPVFKKPGPIIAPLFSPRTARLFAQNAPARPLHIAALSPAVAAEVDVNAQWTVDIAAAPNADAMRLLVEKLLQSPLSG